MASGVQRGCPVEVLGGVVVMEGASFWVGKARCVLRNGALRAILNGCAESGSGGGVCGRASQFSRVPVSHGQQIGEEVGAADAVIGVGFIW